MHRTHNPTITKMCIPTPMNERASCSQTNVSSNKLNRRNRINIPKLVTRKPPDQIRQQYLSRLGFTNDKSGPLKAVSSQHPQNSSVKALKKFSYVDDLNDSGFSDDDSYADKTGTSPTDVTDLRTSMRKEKRSVSFHESVNVHLIPNKDMYSRRIKDYIWTEFDEIATNAERNSVEFAAENWDWRQACEEENFFTCPESGQKIHPAHVHWLDQIMAKRMLNRNRPHALLQAGQCPGFNQFPCPVRF
jgi:hypothetical protein